MSGSPYSPVPTVGSDPAPEPFHQLDVDPDAFGAGVAKAGEHLGGEIDQLVAEQNKIALDLQHQHNETMVLDAATEGSKQIGALEAEYRQLHGNDAIAKLPEYQKKIRDIGAGIGQTLKNPEAQRAFRQRFDGYMNGAEHGFGLHAADEADKAYVSALEGSISAAQSRLVRNAGLGNAAPNYDELLDGVARLGDKMGWDPAQTNAYLQSKTSAVVEDLVAARISRDQFGAAKQVFDSALKANVPGTDVPLLDADHQARIAHTIRTEQKSREALARAENFQDAQDLMQSDIQSRMIEGKPLGPEAEAKIRAGLTPKQWDRYKSQVKQADMVYAATGDLSTTPNLEIAGLVAKLKPVGGDPEYAPKLNAYNAAKAIADRTIAARNADPARAAAEGFKPVQFGWQGFTENPNDPGWAQSAVKRSLAAQGSLGIPEQNQKPLPKVLADNIAGQIASANPQDAQTALSRYSELFGDHWEKVYRQISPKMDPAVKVAATMDDPAKAALLIDTSRKPKPDLLKVAGIQDRDLSEAVLSDPMFTDFRDSMGPYGVSDGNTIAVAQALQTQALGYMVSRGSDLSTAVDAATKDILGNMKFGDVNGQKFAAPNDVDVARIMDAASNILARVDVGSFDLQSGLPGRTEADRRATLENNIRAKGYWVTAPGMKGLILYSDRGAVTRYGRPVTYSWDQILAAEEPDAVDTVAETRIPGVN